MGQAQTDETCQCVVCGRESVFRFDPTIITPQLKEAWGISDRLAEAFNRKESMFCSNCGCSSRIRRLAAVLMQTFSEISGLSCKSFAELLENKEFRDLKIAEINACGALHSYLKDHPNLYYSEWLPHREPGEVYDGVRCEDLQCLTYPDDYFDIILTSETLEHVPDPGKAWQEIFRTLKDGGYHIFTIPVLPSQPTTVKRANLVDGKRDNLLAAAYHGAWGSENMFVYTDFGMDLVEKLDGIGLKTEIFYQNPKDEMDVAVVFRSRKSNNQVSATSAGGSKMLEWTGERYLPWLEDPCIGYEHLHRYAYATQFVTNKKVLDLACGEGYGSRLLARTADLVVGVDIDADAVRHARNKYIRSNLQFKKGSITDIPIEGRNIFDAIVCFEALEHIEDHEKLLKEVKRLLTKDGLFIVSTPNKWAYSDEPKYENPFHVHELYLDEFTELFEKYFRQVKILGQRIYCNSNIWPIFSKEDGKLVEYVIDRNPKEFVFVESDKRVPLYFIAIASDADGDIEERRSALIDVSDAFLKQKDEQITAHVREQERLAGEINRLSSTVQAQHKALAENGEHANRLAGDVTKLQGLLGEKTEEVKQLLAERDRLAQETDRLQMVLQAQHQVMAEKEEGSKQLLAERDRLAQKAAQLRAMVDGQQQALRQREQQILQLTGQREVLAGEVAAQTNHLQGVLEAQQQALRQREQQILQLTGQREVLAGEVAAQTNHLQGVLEAQQQELVEIKGSLAWLCIIKYRSAKDKVFPPETHRRNAYDRLNDFLKDLVQLGASGLLRTTWKKTIDEQSSNGSGSHPGTMATVQPAVATPVGQQNESEFLRFPVETWKTESDAFLSDPTRHLIFPLFETPLVSVVIPTFNKVEYLYQCLNSILSHTEVPYELIVVDDCSQDLTAQVLNKIQNIHIERNEQNLDFIRTCNKGASFARGRYIMFLNNDVVVTPNWLSVLTSTIERIPNCGAVGAKLVRPDGNLQEAGSIVWQDGSAMGYGRDDNPLKPEYCYLREVDYCSAACLLVRAELFRDLKGFDERYLPAYYEDADLCLGIRERGYKVIYEPQATVFHYEFGSRSFERAKALMEANQQKLIQKWAAVLSQQYPYGNILKARNRRSERPILVIDDLVPAPYLGSGFPRAYKLIEFLCELNFAVTFIPVNNSTAHQPTTERLQQRGVEVFYGNSFVPEAVLRSRAGHYEAVIVSRPHNGAKYLSLVRECFPDARIIYDAEALFCVREFLRAEVEGRSFSEAEKRSMLHDELDIMRQADIVITASHAEREVILKKNSHDNIVVLGAYPRLI